MSDIESNDEIVQPEPESQSETVDSTDGAPDQAEAAAPVSSDPSPDDGWKTEVHDEEKDAPPEEHHQQGEDPEDLPPLGGD